ETKKPDPFGARKLLEETGVSPERALVIGDSQNDVLTAQNAGLWSLGVTYGFSPESLNIHPPDVLVDSTVELSVALGLQAPGQSSPEVPSGEGFTG
ncbi:MAG TPA: HAD-IA family hydrolase, partial [Terriglobales bacterium]